MIFSNPSGMPADWTLGFQRDGRELLIVMAKSTYALPSPGGTPQPAPDQWPLIQADRFSGEPGHSAPTLETDYAHPKPACDVLLLGSAHAASGRSARTVPVGLTVGSMRKGFRVVGHRRWERRLTGVSASDPEPFRTLPISYDVAFGGTDLTEVAQGRPAAYQPNPVGRGYWMHTDHIDGQPLPNTEEFDAPIQQPSGQYRPMALSPLGRNWEGRAHLAGTYDRAWIERTAPFWPDDFDARYFQAAPSDQVIPHPTGGESVVLANLTADGHRAFNLPNRRVPVTFIPYKGRDLTIEARIDTIVLLPDQDRFTMTWRVGLPLGRSVFDVQEVVVGDMPRAWHRARQFPGKSYYPSLGALVRERQRAR